MSNYFNSFPVVDYNGTYAVNILLRAKFIEASKKINLTFYPYTVKEGERPDQVAFYYYDDPSYSWLVFVSNNIVDPYFEWPMDTNIFAKHIKSKYGSVVDARQKVLHYVDNWFEDDKEISQSAYNSLLPNLKKYWTPATEYARNKTYVRRRSDNKVSTNYILTMTVASATGFTIGERVDLKNGSTRVATGEVTKAAGTTLVIQHIQNAFTANTSYTIVGSSSGTTTSPVSIDDTHFAIPQNELVYWNPITAYDYELDLNESRKTIMLLDNNLKTQVTRELENLMTNG